MLRVCVLACLAATSCASELKLKVGYMLARRLALLRMRTCSPFWVPRTNGAVRRTVSELGVVLWPRAAIRGLGAPFATPGLPSMC